MNDSDIHIYFDMKECKQISYNKGMIITMLQRSEALQMWQEKTIDTTICINLEQMPEQIKVRLPIRGITISVDCNTISENGRNIYE